MKKWVEYQFKNQIKEWDWDYAQYPVANLKEQLGPHMEYVKQCYKDETLPAFFENVFTNPDYIARTAATTDGDVSEQQFRAWLSEYFDLVSGHGHKYIRSFGESNDAIYDIINKELGLDPASTKIRVQIEEPGHYFMMHIDRHKYQEWEVESDKEYVYDKMEDFHKHSIFIIFFNDWAQGQAFQMGDNFLKWKSGDVFNWNYRNVPHGASNFGYETSFVMVITGNKIKKES
jgi:hypothetical protein